MISFLGKHFINIFLFSIFSSCYSEGTDGFFEFGEVELYSVALPLSYLGARSILAQCKQTLWKGCSQKNEVEFTRNAHHDIEGMTILQGYSKKVDYPNLCVKAKEYASLDGLNFNHQQYDSQALHFYRPNKPSITTYVQKCDTIPMSFLRFDWENQHLNVMIRQNPFENEKFTIEVENIQSIPIPRPDILKIPLPGLWKKRMHEDLTSGDGFQVCLAARKRIQETFDGVRITMLDTEPAKTAIFTIESKDGPKRNRIAIPCPSYPQIYVHFEKSIYHMVAVFVENQSKLEDIQVPGTMKNTPSGLPIRGLEDFKREYKFEIQQTKEVRKCGGERVCNIIVWKKPNEKMMKNKLRLHFYKNELMENSMEDFIGYTFHRNKDIFCRPMLIFFHREYSRTSLFQTFSCNPGYEFNKFFVEELNSLCILAKENASLDGLTTADIHVKNRFAITYPQMPDSHQRMCVIAVKCNTIPASYLRLGESVSDIKIAIERNPFVEDKDIKYEVEEVKSHPKPAPVVSPKRSGFLGFNRASKKEKERKRNSISELTAPSERLNICLAARKTVREKKLAEPVMQTSEVKESQELEFELPKGSQTEAAVECPSIPVMYVYFESSPKNVKIVLVKN